MKMNLWKRRIDVIKARVFETKKGIESILEVEKWDWEGRDGAVRSRDAPGVVLTQGSHGPGGLPQTKLCAWRALGSRE